VNCPIICAEVCAPLERALKRSLFESRKRVEQPTSAHCASELPDRSISRRKLNNLPIRGGTGLEETAGPVHSINPKRRVGTDRMIGRRGRSRCHFGGQTIIPVDVGYSRQ
jgi:hypothetical protein